MPPDTAPGSSAATARVAVIVLNWNGCDDTLRCVESLLSSDHPGLEVTVVDNGSTDGSADRIARAFPKVHLIRLAENRGYAGGNNAGLREVVCGECRYVLILNNDAVVDRHTVAALVAASIERADRAVLSPVIRFADGSGRLWYAGAKWDPEALVFRHAGYGKTGDPAAVGSAGETDYASGCALFAPTAAFREVGLLDERFFLTYEEADWCFRARRMGYPSIVVEDAQALHRVSASFGAERTPLHEYFYTRNRLLWAGRHLGGMGFARVLGRTLSELSAYSAGPAGPRPLARRHYWAMRTALRNLSGGSDSPVQRARYLGLRDFILRRFGDCPAEVRMPSAGGAPDVHVSDVS